MVTPTSSQHHACHGLKLQDDCSSYVSLQSQFVSCAFVDHNCLGCLTVLSSDSHASRHFAPKVGLNTHVYKYLALTMAHPESAERRRMFTVFQAVKCGVFFRKLYVRKKAELDRLSISGSLLVQGLGNAWNPAGAAQQCNYCLRGLCLDLAFASPK